MEWWRYKWMAVTAAAFWKEKWWYYSSSFSPPACWNAWWEGLLCFRQRPVNRKHVRVRLLLRAQTLGLKHSHSQPVWVLDLNLLLHLSNWNQQNQHAAVLPCSWTHQFFNPQNKWDIFIESPQSVQLLELFIISHDLLFESCFSCPHSLDKKESVLLCLGGNRIWIWIILVLFPCWVLVPHRGRRSKERKSRSLTELWKTSTGFSVAPVDVILDQMCPILTTQSHFIPYNHIWSQTFWWLCVWKMCFCHRCDWWWSW